MKCNEETSNFFNSKYPGIFSVISTEYVHSVMILPMLVTGSKSTFTDTIMLATSCIDYST